MEKLRAIALCLLLLTALPLGQAPQASPALDPALLQLRDQLPSGMRTEAVTADADETISLFVGGSLDLTALYALGAEVQTDVGSLRILRIPRSGLSALLAMPGLERVQLARELQPQLNLSVPAIDADELWGGAPPNYTGLTGKGVIIGFVDTGIDVKHADFKLSDGKTRILSLWDQTTGTSNPPPGFTYGTEWTAAQIDANQCMEIDGLGHGTFLASIAASNGRATGNGQPMYQYVGVAPEADLVIVKSLGRDTDIVNGVSYIFQRATQLGKPAVVGIAFGTQKGPHDGTDPMEQSLNSLTRSGRVICMAAGNYGDQPIHGQATVSPSVPKTISVNVPTHVTGGQQKLVLEGWYEQRDVVNVSLRTPSGRLFGPVSGGSSLSQETGEGSAYVANGTYTNTQGDKQIYVYISRAQIDVAAGLWKLELSSQTSNAHVDLWLVDYYWAGACPAIVDGLTYDENVVTPATADSVITVGAFTTKRNWIALNGTGYGYLTAVMDDIAPWSSRGKSRDGRYVPELCAPGYGVGAAKSADATVSPTSILQDGVHYMNYGTSAAAAHTAGAVALLLQENPQMSPSAIKLALRGGARQDAKTGQTPNVTWGYGKLNVGSGAVAVGDERALHFGFRTPYPNPTRREAAFEFALSAGDLADPTARVELGIYDIRGRLVASMPGKPSPGPQRLVWSGLCDDGGLAPVGIYMAHLQVGSQTSVRKFVRVRG